VVVQGPPGTGKTHTIANVICHYLAEGKRVLVTSKGESALAVLRSQLPAPIQSLTVSLLTSEREGLKQLEQGVSKITSEITNLNKQDVRKEIERCQHRIDQLHQQITGVDRELADWAKKNINPAPPSLDELRPAELARHVLDAQQTYGWFPDDLDGRPEHEIQFNLTDVEKLREARIHVGSDLIYLGKTLPKTDTLPTAAEIGDLHRSLLELESVSDEIDERRVPRFRVITSQHLNAAAQARDLLIDAINVRRRLSEKWTNWLCENYAAGDAFQPVFAMVCQIAGELGGLVEARRQFLGVAINWSDEWDNDEELYIAVRNAAMNRSPFGLLPFGKKSAREKYQQIRLNGKIPDNPEDWRWIESHVSLRRQSRTIAYRWNSLCAECPAPELPTEPSHALRSTEMLLAQMNEARRWVLELAPAVAQEITNIFAELQADGIADDPDKMETLATAISIRLKRHQLENARQEALRLKNLFDKEDLPAFKQGLSFTEHMLGRGRYETVIVENAWQGIIDEFERLHSLNESFSTILYITEQISKCGALRWATHLQKVPHVEGEQDWTPENWTLAWKWSRQSGYLRGIDGRERVQSLASQRLTLQNDLSSSYTRLIEHLTWLKLRETLDQDRGLMAALQQYMAAIRGIGTGTGIRAVRYRQDARRAMTKANKAIRCWIMPHWRVSESLPSELALFDLVIIDEASQSDLWALPAMLRAKKLLIVGDNKQVSPSANGVRESDIRQLHARFLRTLPFGDVLSPEKSVYDLASVLFASDLIRLREHFRCVEPIIQFSNRLSYNNEIKCLRIPTASERITPPLVDVFVRGGYRDGRSVKINRVEARAIVDEIKYLSSTPSFENRTIGVVSLLGSDQPKHIFEMLISELGEEKILRHQIRCGDAMTFQGREADIVFISMVSDGDSVRALSGEMYEQRFNVAVSRAKDRLYLYRSFCRDDLKDNDLRARLLDHFAAPLRRDPEKKGRERCESDFERAMFDRLTAAGYRVTPQVSAGGYRIDLVVEGHQGRRLAVECDGDQYHTPDVWMDDLRRQRTLERAGWNFWRCWGSSFLRDPDACMADLFKTLEQFQIKPIGAAEIDLTDIVEYREILEDTAEGDNTSKFVAEEDLSQKIRKSDIVPHESGFALGTNPNSKQSISDRVEVGDSVRYCAASDQDDEVFVTIVPYESNPNLGLINCNTAIAKALLGCRQNDEVDVALPHETKRLRVLQIQKHVRQGQP
jgi:very-short-patch-repair endonuclease